MINTIGIIGCGWLGLPLAEDLIKKGFKVNGTTTSKEKMLILSEKDITPFHIALFENSILGNIKEFLKGVTILIINIPPKLRGKGPKESFIDKITLLHTAIKNSKVTKVLFISSTAVYGDAEGTVTERTTPIPTTESGKQLLECERLFQNDTVLDTTIVRFGGLLGPNRHPITMLSGKKNLEGGNAPVNLIHLDDCIGIIQTVIKIGYWGEVLNAVYPEHPTKQDYYTKQAIKRALIPPVYNRKDSKNHKLISSCSIFLNKYYTFFATIN